LLQVVRANYNTQVGISTYNTDVYLGLNATITPSATDSKILIFYNIQGGEAGGLYHTQLRRNDVTIFTDVSRTIQGSTLFKVPYSYYDSPASTSAQTYKIYGQQMNQGSGNSATFQWNGSASEIILMEIGA
jgi:hypothetical protein